MGKLKKRSDGRYQTSFVFEGKRYSVLGKTLDELEEKKHLKREQLKAREEEHENPLFRNYYKAFTEIRRKRVKGSTLLNQDKWYRKCADIVIPGCEKKFQDMRMRDIRPNDMKFIQMELSKSGLSSRSVNDCMAHLSHVFSSAIKDETIDRNPCRCIEPVKRTEPEARDTVHRALTEEETTGFFEEASGSFFLNHCKMMLLTGMRVGELGALMDKDIDTAKGRIRVRRTVTRDEIGAYIIGETPKTDSSNRNIPLTDQIIAVINDQKARNRILFGPCVGKPLFPSPDGGLLKSYAVNRDIKRICGITGIDYFSCHAFRATFATRWIEQRPQDYKILSEILGHAGTKITLDLYAHVMEASKQAAMKEIVIAI